MTCDCGCHATAAAADKARYDALITLYERLVLLRKGEGDSDDWQGLYDAQDAVSVIIEGE